MLHFIRKSLEFIYFLILFLKYKSFKNHIKKEYSGTVAVLANGPSLKEVLPNISTDEEFKNVDFIVLNFFAFENIFFEVKPKHYCLADPMFFKATHRLDNVLKLFKILDENVDWKMSIYIPKHYIPDFKSFSKIKNKNISIVGVNNTPYYGFEKYRNFFYKKGLAIPIIGTVANLAIYVGINLGYNRLNLYGVDHTFFDSLCVNDNNEICNREAHFYSNGKSVLMPIKRNDNDEIYKMSYYISSISVMFKSHDLLQNFAKYMNVNIENQTGCSLIDSYNRPNKLVSK